MDSSDPTDRPRAPPSAARPPAGPPAVAARLPPHSLPTVRLDVDPLDHLPDTDPGVATTADHLGYVIYTSGSTGRPKGVAMRRGALGNLIDWQLTASSAGPGDVTLQ